MTTKEFQELLDDHFEITQSTNPRRSALRLLEKMCYAENEYSAVSEEIIGKFSIINHFMKSEAYLLRVK
jgi:hypothetical protein